MLWVGVWIVIPLGIDAVIVPTLPDAETPLMDTVAPPVTTNTPGAVVASTPDNETVRTELADNAPMSPVTDTPLKLANALPRLVISPADALAPTPPKLTV